MKSQADSIAPSTPTRRHRNIALQNPMNPSLSPTSSFKRIPLVLLLLRLTVFTVMLMWTLDKFIRPDHAASVFAKYYSIGGMSQVITFVVGVLELVLLAAFVLGIMKRFTYGAVLVLHAISTLSSFKHYLTPFEGGNIMFFAAWPMLAACIGLYLLRDLDSLGVVPARNPAASTPLPKS